MVVLAKTLGRRFVAHHVDHGLRPDSGDDFAVVAALAARFGGTAVSHRVRVDEGPDLEQRARWARRSCLPAHVCTAHTADDQAETVMLAVLRGTGVWGLTGIGDPQRRPLLALRRVETAEVCAAAGVTPLVDPMNADPRFRRNRVRGELLPLAADVAGRDTVPLLARLADHAAELAAVIDTMATHLDASDARALAAAPRPIAVAALRAAWRRATGQEHVPDSAAMTRMLEVVRGPRPRCDVAHGWSLARHQQRLHFERSHDIESARIAPLG